MKLSDVTVANTSPMVGPEQITKVGEFVVQGSRYRGGTAAERGAVPSAEKFPGLHWEDTDSGKGVYVWSGTTWVAVDRVVSQRTWKFPRTGSASTPFAGGFGLMTSGTITDAPAGDYLIGGTSVVSGSVNSVGNMKLQAGPTNLSLDMRSDVSVAAEPYSFQVPYEWAGGDLLLQLQFQVASGTGTVYLAGTTVWAIYLGP